MTAHATRLTGPIRRPVAPTPRATRIRRAIVTVVALFVVASAVYALLTSPRLANATQNVCSSATHAGTPDQTPSCAAALYDFGFPE